MKHIADTSKADIKMMRAHILKWVRYLVQHKDSALYYSVAALVIFALSLSAQRYRELALNPDGKDTDVNTEIAAVNTQWLPTPVPEVNAMKNTWIMPVNGEICGEYSADTLTWSESMGQWSLHCAVDIRAAASEAVRAAADGVVTDVYSHSLLGNTVEIDHGEGHVVRYCSLSTTQLMQIGSTVAQGDIIGGVGTCTAEAELGSHLHLECTVNREPIDFMTLISKTDASDLQE